MNVPMLVCSLLALVAIQPPALAQQGGLIANHRDRERLILDGDWPIVIDPYDTGTIDYLSRPRDNGFWTSPGPAGPHDPEEYSFTDDETLAVPGDWNSQREDLFFYEGTVWYRREFELTPEADARYFLCVGAASTRSTIWINGERAAESSIGFTPIHTEITDWLADGQNNVTIRVNNQRRADGVPALNTDWWNYGGLTRSISIVKTPQTFIRDLEVFEDSGRMAADIELDGPRAPGMETTIAIRELGLELTGRADDHGRLRLTADLPDTVERWSPGSPRLYRVTASIAGDTLHERIGFRTIETRGSDILLNGEPVFLRGICIHEEALSREGRAWSENDARELLGLAKELGCNYVRLAHYTHNEHMLRVADELGLLVWAEIPVYWTLEYDNPTTLEEAKQHLSAMIDRDRSRASIIIWSIGNETGDDPVRTAFRRALGEHVRELDPTRLLSAAMFARAEVVDGVPVRLIVEDPFGELADVLAINTYIGWYWGQAEDLRGCRVERAWDKPLLISEFGAGIKHGLRGEPTDRWTEDMGVRLYEETLAWSDRIEGLAGLSPWILKDFRSPRRQLTGVQDWWNRKGLVDEQGRPKLVWDVMQRHYKRKAAEYKTNENMSE